MKKVIKKVICDICNRDLDDVDKPWNHGVGALIFSMNAGGDGGGAYYSEKYDYICVECCKKLVKLLKKQNLNAIL